MQEIIKQIIQLFKKLETKTEQAIFAEKIERIRKQIKMSATSSFRTRKRNAYVGGMINSKHLENLAVDVILDFKIDSERLQELCKNENLTCLDEKNHFHIQIPKNA